MYFHLIIDQSFATRQLPAWVGIQLLLPASTHAGSIYPQLAGLRAQKGHLYCIVIEIIAIFYENSPILRKFDLFWPPVTSNMTWSKNDLSIFCRTRHGLSNSVYRLSLSFLVFEFTGWGQSSAPPPGRAKVAQTPGRARVQIFVLCACSKKAQTKYLCHNKMI